MQVYITIIALIVLCVAYSSANLRRLTRNELKHDVPNDADRAARNIDHQSSGRSGNQPVEATALPIPPVRSTASIIPDDPNVGRLSSGAYTRDVGKDESSTALHRPHSSRLKRE